MNDADRKTIIGWLAWFGIDAWPEDCDVCSDGSVYYGLTMIAPVGTIG